MGRYEEMPKYKVLSARVDPEQHRRIKSMITEAGGTMDRFIQDAVAEKMARGGMEITDVGPFRDLRPEDRTRVESLITILREHPDNNLLRDVLDGHRVVLLRLLQ